VVRQHTGAASCRQQPVRHTHARTRHVARRPSAAAAALVQSFSKSNRMCDVPCSDI
jgi:hypothetical protein